MNIVHRQVIKKHPVTTEKLDEFIAMLEKRRSEIGGQRNFFTLAKQGYNKVYWPQLLTQVQTDSRNQAAKIVSTKNYVSNTLICLKEKLLAEVTEKQERLKLIRAKGLFKHEQESRYARSQIKLIQKLLPPEFINQIEENKCTKESD